MRHENSVRGILDAAARLNPYLADRLVPFGEALSVIGVKSRTTGYKLIADGELSPVNRGRHVFFLESELQAYIARLASTRGTTRQAEVIACNKRIAASMVAKRIAASSKEAA